MNIGHWLRVFAHNHVVTDAIRWCLL